MKILPRYFLKTDLIGNFQANSKDEFYHFIIAFLSRGINCSVWVNGKKISPESIESKISPVAERFFNRQRACKM